MFAVQSAFYISLTLLGYVYIGYPLIVWLSQFLTRRSVAKSDYLPFVSILIPAYNEAANIEKTILNKLAQKYPRDLFEIVVVCDGSDDGTDKIVEHYADQGVRLIRQRPRAGKTAALNLALPQCRGDIIVFSDANSIYHERAILNLTRNFADNTVGYVTGKMVYTNPSDSSVGDGCTAYMRYENFIRRCESRIGSVVGVDGGIDAVRKALYEPMRSDQLPDLVLPLLVVAKGFRVIYEPDAILHEEALASAADEYRMRVRVALRALWAIKDMKHLLNLRKYGWFAWQLWSHKLLRYCAFAFLAGAYTANLLLLTAGKFYDLFFILQNLAYLAAFLSLRTKSDRGLIRFLYAFEYFVLVNLAAGHAFCKFIVGEKQALWTPRKG